MSCHLVTTQRTCCVVAYASDMSHEALLAVVWHIKHARNLAHQLPNHILLETCWSNSIRLPHDVAYLWHYQHISEHP
jgi:hypothetical protein